MQQTSSPNMLSVDTTRTLSVPDESGVWSPDGASSSRPSSSDDTDIHFPAMNPLPFPPHHNNQYTGHIEKIFATYGFIMCENMSRFFFHFGTCKTKPEHLAIGDEVEFMLGPDKKSGRTHAQGVFRKPKEGETFVEPRVAYNSGNRYTDVWLKTHGRLNPVLMANTGGDYPPPPASPFPVPASPMPHYPYHVPMSAPPAAFNGRKFDFEALLENRVETGKGLVAAVMNDGGLIIEYLDHSRLCLAKSEEVSLEEFCRGNEVKFDIVWVNGNSRIQHVRKLARGTHTGDYVRGGDVLNGRVVKELNVSTELNQLAGVVESARRIGEAGSVRRYGFTLCSLSDPKYLGKGLSIGSLVTFNVQAEGKERYAVNVAPAPDSSASGSASDLTVFSQPHHNTPVSSSVYRLPYPKVYGEDGEIVGLSSRLANLEF